MKGQWLPASQAPEGVAVNTRIDDKNGGRMEHTLRRQGNLWVLPDGSMYVYYSPTHYWKWTP